MLELSNFCHCVQHPWKRTSRDFWSYRNERKPLSEQKCVLRKCCWVSQKWWMLEQYARHLCSSTEGSISQSRIICQVLCTGIHGISVWYWGVHWLKWVHLPSFVYWYSWHLCLVLRGPLAKVGSFAKFCVLVFKASLLWYWGDFQSSRNEKKSLSKQKCVFRKCCWVSQKQQMWELSNFYHCVQHPENLLVGISGVLGMKESHFQRKNVFWGNGVGYLRNGEC